MTCSKVALPVVMSVLCAVLFGGPVESIGSQASIPWGDVTFFSLSREVVKHLELRGDWMVVDTNMPGATLMMPASDGASVRLMFAGDVIDLPVTSQSGLAFSPNAYHFARTWDEDKFSTCLSGDSAMLYDWGTLWDHTCTGVILVVTAPCARYAGVRVENGKHYHHYDCPTSLLCRFYLIDDESHSWLIDCDCDFESRGEVRWCEEDQQARYKNCSTPVSV